MSEATRSAPTKATKTERAKGPPAAKVGKSPRRAAPTAEAAAHDPRFSRLVRALQGEPGVTYGGKGFGSSALKLDGKIFAMLTSRDRFVVKLTQSRVSELVKAKQGRAFDPGHGRLMKEWFELPDHDSAWRAFAEEALATARGAQRRGGR